MFLERLQYKEMVGLLLELQRLFGWPHVENSHFVTVIAKLVLFCFSLWDSFQR